MDPSTIDTFANSITALEKNIENLENEADALSNIDIESTPKAGTAAYEALNKALQKTGKSMSDYIKMSAKDKIKTIGNAQINNLQN
jgi:exonuclease VII small subunit